MEITNSKIGLLLSAVLLATAGCQMTDGSAHSSGEISVMPDFESDSFFDAVIASHATASVVKGLGVTAGDRALKVEFDSVSEANKFKYWPHVRMHPAVGSWNWNAKGSLTLDVTNPESQAITVIFKLADNVGVMGSNNNQLNYSVVVPAGETKAVDMLFNGSARKLDGYWGGENINLRQIVEFQAFVQGPVAGQSAIFDNFNLVDATGDFVAASGQQIIEDTPIPSLDIITDFSPGKKNYIAYERNNGAIINELETDMGGAISVLLSADKDYPNVTFKADQPWDWSEHSDFNLAFDIENLSSQAMQLFVRIDDAENAEWGGIATGVEHSMSSYITINPGDSSTYYITLAQEGEQVISGLRAEPPKKAYNAQAISFGWGERILDLSNIVSFQLYAQTPSTDLEFTVDSIRLIPNIDADAGRYEGLVDEFGQYTGYEWDRKVAEESELATMGHIAKLSLKSSKQMAGRSIYGGWSEGPKLEATGFFRTEKVDGKWALVDPQGYLFFATGLSNIRMDDTVTITGIDYADKGSRSGRELKSSLRNSMFDWLPAYSDPLADNYSYADRVHSGAVEKGEVFSFYGANLQRKYGGDRNQALETWEAVTIDRMLDWGFTTLGNWADPRFYNNNKVAYVANGWIVGDHATISTGNDYWGPIPDPFDPEFTKSTRKMVSKLKTEVKKDDPWLMGVFVDNEISWGNTKNDANHYGLVINALSYNGKKSPAKAAFTAFLKDKYWSIDDLNSSWGSKIISWTSFDKGFEYRKSLSANMKKDYAQMLELLAEQYFATVRKELKKALPNHLYLGSRFADWGVTPEIARSAAKYVDVMSYNLYAEDIDSKGDWSLLPELDKPSLIGEFHFGATDSGLFHGGIVAAANQVDRAKKFKQYMLSVIDNPYFVGAHWFQYLDSPATGRAWDGENYNIGFVSITDTPYTNLVEAAKDLNKNLYKLRYYKK